MSASTHRITTDLDAVRMALATGTPIEHLPGGAPLAARVRSLGSWSEALFREQLLSRDEATIVSICETSGALPEGLERVLDRRRRQRSVRQVAIARAAYPAVVVLLAPVLLSLPVAVLQGVGPWLRVALPLPLGFMLGGVLLVRAVRHDGLRRGILRLPGLASWDRNRRSADVLFAVSVAWSAGASLGDVPERIMGAPSSPRRIVGAVGLVPRLVGLRVLGAHAAARLEAGLAVGRADEVLTQLADEAEHASYAALRRLIGAALAVGIVAVVLVVSAVVVGRAREAWSGITSDLDRIHEDAVRDPSFRGR